MIGGGLVYIFNGGNHYPLFFNKRSVKRDYFFEKINGINARIGIPDGKKIKVVNPDDYSFEPEIIKSADIPNYWMEQRVRLPGRDFIMSLPVNPLWSLKNPELMDKKLGTFYGMIHAGFSFVKESIMKNFIQK